MLFTWSWNVSIYSFHGCILNNDNSLQSNCFVPYYLNPIQCNNITKMTHMSPKLRNLMKNKSSLLYKLKSLLIKKKLFKPSIKFLKLLDPNPKNINGPGIWAGPGRCISTCNKRYTNQWVSLWIICGGSLSLGHFRFPLSYTNTHSHSSKKPKTLTLSRVLSPSSPTMNCSSNFLFSSDSDSTLTRSLSFYFSFCCFRGEIGSVLLIWLYVVVFPVFAVSGEVPEEPVVSRNSGLLFEKRLIERHISVALL